jgi:hypothetical protein
MVYVLIALGSLSVMATIVVVSACRIAAQCAIPEKPLPGNDYPEARPSFARRPA